MYFGSLLTYGYGLDPDGTHMAWAGEVEGEGEGEGDAGEQPSRAAAPGAPSTHRIHPQARWCSSHALGRFAGRVPSTEITWAVGAAVNASCAA